MGDNLKCMCRNMGCAALVTRFASAGLNHRTEHFRLLPSLPKETKASRRASFEVAAQKKIAQRQVILKHLGYDSRELLHNSEEDPFANMRFAKIRLILLCRVCVGKVLVEAFPMKGCPKKSFEMFVGRGVAMTAATHSRTVLMQWHRTTLFL